MMWSKTTYWNPLFFVGTWVGVTFLMYSLGPSGYPGWRRHVALALVSVPLWWWFELVNARVENWKYIILYDYGDVGYAFLASLTFSTVVPALDSAWRMYVGLIGPAVFNAEPDRRLFVGEVVAGAASLVALFALPGQLFGLVWVGPFLTLDGLVGLRGGRNLAQELRRGEWKTAVAVGLGGVTCGFFWEFWNFWATPKWVYDIPYVEFWHVFEMPILGYAGYVPFAWSVYQLVELLTSRPSAPAP